MNLAWLQCLLLILLVMGHVAPVHALKLCVVGGGAAGYFAAIQAAQSLRECGVVGATVTIMEMGKEPLQKVSISGGGRCNVMHDPSKGAKTISRGYPRGEKELLGPYTKAFGPQETYEWFNSRTPLKTEKDGRVFPTSDNSSSIIAALQSAAIEAGVDVQCATTVKSIARTHTSVGTDSDTCLPFTLTYTSRAVGGERGQLYECRADRVIMATGSSKAGHDIVAALGHCVVTPKPSLFSFKVQDAALRALMGASVPNARVRLVMSKAFVKANRDLVRPNNLKIFEQEGPLLVTHQGLSGPAVLRLSAYGARVMAEMNYDFSVAVNWVPDVCVEELIAHFQETKCRFPLRAVGKAFPRMELTGAEAQEWTGKEEAAAPGTVPRRLWHYLVGRAGIPLDVSSSSSSSSHSPPMTWGGLKKKQLEALAREVCDGQMAVSGKGQYRDEFVTAGGVDTKEVDWGSMASTKVPGLFLCGEVLNVDGVTGGYNFQSAWTAGYLAGRGAAAATAATPREA